MNVDKSLYREFCDTADDMPVFSQYWWLDAVAGPDKWDVVLVKNGKKPVAALPFSIQKGRFFTTFGQPVLTQKLGPYIQYPDNQKYASKLAFEKNVMRELIQKLEKKKFDAYTQSFDASITNFLPFHWRGFEATVRYTYLLGDLSDADRLWDEMKSNVKTDIKKAKKTVRVSQSDDIEAFYRVNSLSFERQKMAMPYPLEFIKKLDGVLKKKNQRALFFTKDEQGNIHAVLYLVWDKNSAYYLMGGGDPKYRNSGAQSLLVWEAIQFASKVSKKFDFEGSMIEPVERFFRAFGARQTPMLSVSGTRSAVLRWGQDFVRLAVATKKLIAWPSTR